MIGGTVGTSRFKTGEVVLSSTREEKHLRLGAIDIGSNSIHLVVAQAIPGQHLGMIDREKDMIRLGAGTLRLHRMSRKKIDRAITVLKRYKQVCEAQHVDHIIATATAAVREAHNADEFIERVKREAGLDVSILPGIEEARLIALAVSEVTDFNGRRALIVDIGGGSTELIVTAGAEPDLLLSVRLGAVRLAEKFVTTDPISDKQRRKLVSTIEADLTRVAWEVKSAGYDFAIGTSGTIVNLVNLVSSWEGDRSPAELGIDPFHRTITLEQLKRANRRLWRMTNRQRSLLSAIEERRSDIIVPGGLLLEATMTEVGAESITSCDWALREGVILDYLVKNEPVEYPNLQGALIPAFQFTGSVEDRERSPTGEERRFLNVRMRSVLSVARRYDYDARHSHHIAALAVQIFDETRAIHGMGISERELLEYASLLHDIGYHIAHNNHHRHSLYLIKNSEMPGFTGEETAIMATIARYHRGSSPLGQRARRATGEHDDFRLLDRRQQEIVIGLAAILRMADGLDRSYSQKVSGLLLEAAGKRLSLYVRSEENCTLEIWAASRKAKWFEKAFRVSIRFKHIGSRGLASEQIASAPAL
jgi:exopolyphosphatase/guanosine-5'-triphosphate,3'-diphosphate pyrophosphatase